MRKASTLEIRFHESEMVVSPSVKAINRPDAEGAITVEVESALVEPRENLVTDLVVDLAKVAWISSVGLNELIRLQACTRASGVGIRLKNLSETVRDVFRLTRLERVFEIETLASAEQSCEPSQVESAATL